MSIREDSAVNIVDTLKEISVPKPALVTRDPFDVEKLAITQFPALLIQQTQEERATITMGITGSGRRTGVMTFEIRGFVRGTELDTKRNDLIEAVENALDSDRYRNVTGVTDTQIVTIEIIPRLQPLAEFVITVEVKYNYARGTQ
jgi:hypothetical protein